MSYEFKKLSEVEALAEVPEGATVLAEVGGAIKRIPGSGLGGGKVLKIICSNFGEYLSEASTMVSAPSYTFETNMTFAEAQAAFRACELDGCVFYFGEQCLPAMGVGEKISDDGIPYFYMSFMIDMTEMPVYWSEEYGITNNDPYGK